jgi:hypothetical protein
MTGVYLALGDTYDLHTRAVKRFGTDLAPRMDDINDRMKKIGERLNQPASSPGREQAMSDETVSGTETPAPRGPPSPTWACAPRCCRQ